MKQLFLFQEPQKVENSSKHLAEATYWKVYIDGAARNNPGPAGAGIYLVANEKMAEEWGFYLGFRTNNQAEYYSLLLGIYLTKKRIKFDDPVLIISDSQLLVRQIQGSYKIKHPELKPLHNLAKELLKGINYDIAHVAREENTKADELANKGIDERIPVPHDFIEFLSCYDLSF